jgi:serine/threonine-protein kinase
VAEWKVPGFTEQRLLGSGGFGEVVLARHDGSGTLVAIKYLRQNLLSDAEFTELFRAEAAVLATVDDPNVVRLYEYVESPQGAAIVMELVDGVSLRDILIHQGATTAEAALVVLQGSLLGLAAAHQRGVVHRDYKPENVLVNGDGASKLTDFGIAARAGDSPIPAGTMMYAPPEQFSGTPASPASDVYAATATFYECLVGRPPFTGDSGERLLYQHLAEPVPLEPVPEPLRPLVTAGMAKDPGDRPADASTFVTELKAIAAGACGRDWEQRGRSQLGEAALLLAALWPAGAPPALQGSTVERISLIRPITGLKAAIAVGVVAVVAAAGTALAVQGPGPRTSARSVAAVQQISLQPSSPSSSSLKPSVKPSPKITVSSSSPAALAATTPPALLPAPTVSATSPSSKPSPKPKPSQPSPKPSPSPSPSPSASPSPSITLHPPSSAPPSSSQPPSPSPPAG